MVSHGFTCVPHPDPPPTSLPIPSLDAWDKCSGLVLWAGEFLSDEVRLWKSIGGHHREVWLMQCLEPLSYSSVCKQIFFSVMPSVFANRHPYLVVQTVKNLPAMWESWIWSLGWGDSVEKGMATHSSILAWRIPMDRGVWQATVHGATKNKTWLRELHTHRC